MLKRVYFILIFFILLLSITSAVINPTDWATKGKNYGRNYFVADPLPLDNGHLNLKWKRFLGERIEVEMEPLVVGDYLYIGVMNGKMYALNKTNGSTIWVYETGMGITDTPTVADVNGNKIIFGSTNGIIYCIDAYNGNLQWTYETGAAIMSTPSFYGGDVFVGSLDKTFYAIDVATGNLEWSYKTSGPISTTSAIGEYATDQYGVFVATGDNVAYGFDVSGSLLWSNQMSGAFTKRTTVVFGKGSGGKPVVMFVTRKPGDEYSQHKENIPGRLQRQFYDIDSDGDWDQSGCCIDWNYDLNSCSDINLVPKGTPCNDNLPSGSCDVINNLPCSGNIVLEEWPKFYQTYSKRRPLYYYNAQSGVDLWEASSNKSLYTPMYLPYWGEYSPLVDEQGNALFASSAVGGDNSLEHDTRLWKIDLETGEYSHISYGGIDGVLENHQCRFDEVGRMTLAGDVYYQTISEDVGYYNISSGLKKCNVFGDKKEGTNGIDISLSPFSTHREPIELEEMPAPYGTGEASEIFGGIYKQFTRFGSSTPGGIGGANDAISPLAVQDNEAYLVQWGHVYVLTSQNPTPIKDWGVLDKRPEPSTNKAREDFENELGQRIQGIVNSGNHIGPITRDWDWQGASGIDSIYWTHGEVVASLSNAIPYVEEPLKSDLIVYLKKDINSYILNNSYYQFISGCVDYDTNSVHYNCPGNGIDTIWYWGNNYQTLYKFYGLYNYVNKSGDLSVISGSNWTFIRGKYYNNILNSNSGWNDSNGFFTFRYWNDGASFKPTLQMAGIYAIREMADLVGDTATRDNATYYLNMMMEKSVYWGKYVRHLYNTGELQRDNLSDWQDWGYNQEGISPIPLGGYIDVDNDYRQIITLDSNKDEKFGPVDYTNPRQIAYPYRLIGYHPIIREFSGIYRNNLSDELNDYIDAVEMYSDWWYMNDYSHIVVYGGHEEDSGSPLLSSDLFQAKAYVFNQTFDELAPWVPWEFEDYGYKDIFRIQNLVTLLQAPDEGSSETCTHTADNNPNDCKISREELNSYVVEWKSNSAISLTQIMETIGKWKAGGY